MVRAPSIDKNGIRKGEWSKEEDDKLRAYINRYGIWNWRQLPHFAGLSRCGKSCRLRWKNYLQPNVKRGNYTKQEEDLIFNLHNQLGKKWSVIATKLPGRTDNEIKNYWHTHLKKRTQGQNLTLPSNQKKKIKSECQTSQISKENMNQTSSQSDDKHQQIICQPTLSEGLTGSPNESCCSELSQSYSDAPLNDLFSRVQKNGVDTKSCDNYLSQQLRIEDYVSPQGSSCSEMSFSYSDVSDLMAWFGEDNSTAPTFLEGSDDFWSGSLIETDNYMMNAYKHEQAFVDPGLVYPTSPTTDQEVFLWSYDLSDECIR